MYIIIGIILVLMMFSVPVTFSIGIGSILYCFLVGVDSIVLPQRIFVSLDVFSLLAIPLFLFAGNLMNISGITMRILNFSRNLVGYITGGLGHVNVLASMIFAGMSGSAVADAAGLGVIELEMMTKGGFDKEFSAAITLASATLGPIIPPSIMLVIYATVSNASVGRLLLAGLFPGIVMGISLMIMVYIIARKKKYPKEKWPGIKNILISFKDAFLPLLTPVIVIGGIMFGILTPSEAGAIASLYALILGSIVYRKIKIKDLYKVLLDTALTTGMIGLLIGVSSVFAWIITIEGIPQKLATAILLFTTNKFVVLILIDILVLILGCFVDSGPLLVLLVPIFLPLLNIMNIDIVHFGIIITVGVMIGEITPPFGMCLYTISGISNIGIEKIAKAVLPFFFMLVISLLIFTFLPILSIFLPNIIFG